MASRWSSETVVAEFRDLQASAMGVDCYGQFAVLAGRRCLALIDLDRLTEPVRKTQRLSKWEVSAAEWNPNPDRSSYFAIASNHRAELLNVDEGELRSANMLRAHTRVISDLNWSPFESNLIATCSVDTYIYIWDLRDCRRPCVSMSAVAGSSQVKWNKVCRYTLATTHEGDVRLWDHRKPNSPVQYLAAHLSKIHSLDWRPQQQYHLVTSSQDCKVKFWDVTNQFPLVDSLSSGSPVWRARYTPFGEGLVTVVIPQLRRGENSLVLWSVDNLVSPIHTFVGHTDVVLEFGWRRNTKPGYGSKDSQLVTWSKDQSLRIWKIEQQLQRLCGHNVGAFSTEEQDSDSSAGTQTSLNGSIDPPDNQSNHSAPSIRRSLPSSPPPAPIEHSPRSTSPPPAPAPTSLHHRMSLQLSSVTHGVFRRNSFQPKLTLSNNEEELAEEAQDRPPTDPSTPVNGFPGPPSLVNAGSDTPEAGKRSNATTPTEAAIQGSPKTLQQEFSVLNRNLPYIRVEEMDLNLRSCTVLASITHHKVRLQLTFPTTYPNNIAPTITFCNGTTIDNPTRTRIGKILRSTSLQYVKKNTTCLEPCLSQLVASLETCVAAEKEIPESSSISVLNYGMETTLPAPYLSNASSGHFNAFQDATIPFPRTSGASFNGTGHLVCFARPLYRLGAGTDVTPRSLSTLTAYAGAVPGIGIAGMGLSQNFLHQGTPPTYSMLYNTQTPSSESRVAYHQDKRQRSRSRVRKEDGQQRVRRFGMVTIYNVSSLMPIQRRLAELYRLSYTDTVSLCSENAKVAAFADRRDLVQVWNLISLSAQMTHLFPPDPGLCAPWPFHPFGRELLESLIKHYLRLGDIQTVAMFCCVFTSRSDLMLSSKRPPRSISETATAGGSPYHTIHPCDIAIHGVSFGALLKSNRSNSWSDSLDDHELRYPPSGNVVSPSNEQHETDQEKHNSYSRVLDPRQMSHYDGFKKAYADILYQWGLLMERAAVLKYVTVPPEPHRGIDMFVECHSCKNDTRGVQCIKCKKCSLVCSVCRVTVRGSATFCAACSHGGHTQHLNNWFSSHSVCPTGCGCSCLVKNPIQPS